jgi:hypothetical protein
MHFSLAVSYTKCYDCKNDGGAKLSMKKGTQEEATVTQIMNLWVKSVCRRCVRRTRLPRRRPGGLVRRHASAGSMLFIRISGAGMEPSSA